MPTAFPCAIFPSRQPMIHQPARQDQGDQAASSIPVCPVCYISYEVDNADLRPHVLICGHTFCSLCVRHANNCHVCRAPIPRANTGNQPRYSMNFALEEWIRSEKQRMAARQQVDPNFLSTSICLDCGISFDPNRVTIMGETHKSHMTVPLDIQTSQQAKCGLWLIKLMRKGKPNLDRFYSVMQLLMNLALEYQEEYKKLVNYFETVPESTIDFKEDCKNYLLSGLECKKLKNKSVVESLLKLRAVELEFGLQLFTIGRNCFPDRFGQKASEALIDRLKKDMEAPMPVGLAAMDIDSLKNSNLCIIELPNRSQVLSELKVTQNGKIMQKQAKRILLPNQNSESEDDYVPLGQNDLKEEFIDSEEEEKPKKSLLKPHRKPFTFLGKHR